MGTIGKVVSFLFFAMVAIAAITSVISLFEVCTQFVLQKFHINRKLAIAIVCILCLILSIPVNSSLGHVYICGEAGITLFGLDLFTVLDEVTNTVLMPFAALMACIAVGWVLKPENALAEMEATGTRFPGWLRKIYPAFVRFITPALVIIVQISGIYSELQAGNIGVILLSCGLIAVCLILYFVFFANTYTGTNEDEKVA